jgi:hypothetical protein
MVTFEERLRYGISPDRLEVKTASQEDADNAYLTKTKGRQT